MIIIKSPREIELMAESGALLGHVLGELRKLVKPGVSTAFLNDEADRLIREGGGIAAEKGYGGFPASVCASVNEVLIHGIPSYQKILRDGDIVSLDIVVKKNGYCADACRTYPVGICREEDLELINIAKEAFKAALPYCRFGYHLGDIEHAIGAYVAAKGCSVPREYTGHGIGAEMHEDPYIPNYGIAGTGPLLKEGMTLAIEPMVLRGRNALRTLKDGWTVVSKDGKRSSHYENTVVITDDEPRILTLEKGETL